MCGRYQLTRDEIRFRSRFARGEARFALRAHGEIAPTQTPPLIMLEDAELRCRPVRWGLRVAWSGRPLINVRSDSLPAKARWRTLRERGRCLVPATSFFEWYHDGVRNAPVEFSLPEEIFCFAGVREPGASEAFAIITCDARGVVARVHDRMPVILRPEEYDVWLDPEVSFAQVAPLLQPARNENLRATVRPAPRAGEFDFG